MLFFLLFFFSLSSLTFIKAPILSSSPRVTSEDIRVRMREKFKTNRWWVCWCMSHACLWTCDLTCTCGGCYLHVCWSHLPPLPSFVPPSGSSSTFAIRHFTGGETVYDLYGLLNANADTIADDIISTFKSKVRGWGSSTAVVRGAAIWLGGAVG